MIVFSVLLALVLEDWRQNRQEGEVLESVMLSLRAELERNQRVLEAMLPYHEAMRDTFQVRVTAVGTQAGVASERALAVELEPLERLGFQERLGTEASLANGAWEAARASGALSRIGTDELFLLSGAYTTQERLDRALQRLLDKHDRYAVAVVEREASAAALIDFTSGLTEVTSREQELCASYRTLVRRLTGVELQASPRCGSGNVTIR